MKKYFEQRGHSLTYNKSVNFHEISKHDALIMGWADRYAEYVSKFPKLCKKYVCFLRSYEYYFGTYKNVNWGAFDTVFVLNSHIQNNVKFETKLTRNGIDLDNYIFKRHSHGNKILMLANVSHKKGISLLMQVAMLYPEYKFTIAGDIQDVRFSEYVDSLNLSNVEMIGYAKDKQWLFDENNYIICTSPAEGNPNGLIEGMACGLRPLIHTYIGHKGQFPEECFFSSIVEIEIMLGDKSYDSESYRKYVEDNYDMNKVYKDLEEAVSG